MWKTYDRSKFMTMRTTWWIEVDEPNVAGSIDWQLCIHKHTSRLFGTFRIKHLINPISLDLLRFKSARNASRSESNPDLLGMEASEKNLTYGEVFGSHVLDACDVNVPSQQAWRGARYYGISLAGTWDRPYDVMVYVTEIKWRSRSHLTNLSGSRLIWFVDSECHHCQHSVAPCQQPKLINWMIRLHATDNMSTSLIITRI